MTSMKQTQQRPGLWWAVPSLLFSAIANATPVLINEIHYDNTGTDQGEAIEIAGPANTELTGWQVVLYNGNGGASYNTIELNGVLADDTGTGFGFVVITPTSIQNGAPDGLALIDNAGQVVQFLSYEGVFTATNGPAEGLTSVDIGASEGSGTPIGFSLQLTGTGTDSSDFVWTEPTVASFGAINSNQNLGGGEPPPPVSQCGQPATLISAVQGSGERSPLTGETVSIEAVVVGAFPGSMVSSSRNRTATPITTPPPRKVCLLPKAHRSSLAMSFMYGARLPKGLA